MARTCAVPGKEFPVALHRYHSGRRRFAASVCFLVHCRGAVVRHGGVVGEGFALVTREMPGEVKV